MIDAKALFRLSAAGALALTLGGCISLLPKAKPAQLYRFGNPPAAGAANAMANADGERIGVFSGGGSFEQEAAGDRILTVTGAKVAYIAQSRWVAPAQVLFDQAVADAFEGASGRVRLVPRGAPAVSDYVLRLDVRNFETRYDEGPKAAPVVLVRVHAALTRDRNRTVVSDQIFEASVPASDNRVGAIVEAYDKAVSQVLTKLVGWTNEKAA
jgi:cholesterol transport system auxiliary component